VVLNSEQGQIYFTLLDELSGYSSCVEFSGSSEATCNTGQGVTSVTHSNGNVTAQE